MEDRDTGRLRTILLLVLLFGMMGTLLELVLLEHTEELTQWIPLIALALGLATGAALLARPGRAAVQLFRALMAIFIVAGLAGLWLHYTGNAEFELERAPDAAGWLLFRESMMGATPALAPGTMVWFGLVGLGITWRHPAARGD